MKSEKPAHVLQHADRAPKLQPDIKQGEGQTRRKRMAKTKHDVGETMTPELWKGIIEAIGHGATRGEAAKAAGIGMQTIDAYLITNITAYKQIRDAILLWNRRDWSVDLLERIFDDLSMGNTLIGAARDAGVDEKKMPALYRLVRRDRVIREAYDDARLLQAESFFDEIIDIADDSGDDRELNGRVNHEVVNRSKLRIETRKYAMGAMVRKRFGESKHVELDGNIFVNHIQLLTGARKRLEGRKPAVIENDTGEIAPA